MDDASVDSRTDHAASSVSQWKLDLTASERTALQAREPAALGLFYEVYFHRVYAYIRRLLRDEHLAEDVTQDIFMHLHRSLPSYDPTRALRPWVFTIATNKVRDYWRSRRFRDSQREVSAQDAEGGSFAITPAVSPHSGPPDMLSESEVSQQVSEAIAELPEIMRTTLVLRYYEGLTFEAIGKMVDRNETAVRKRYSRALEELRKRLSRLQDLPQK